MFVSFSEDYDITFLTPKQPQRVNILLRLPNMLPEIQGDYVTNFSGHKNQHNQDHKNKSNIPLAAALFLGFLSGS